MCMVSLLSILLTTVSACSNARTFLSYDGATGTTCAEEILTDSSCTLVCESGLEPVGSFYCRDDHLVGLPACEPAGSATEQVTKVAGTFQVTTIRKRTTRMGLEFRDHLRIALAHALVISPSDFDRLDIVLIRPATDSSASVYSLIDVDYEILLGESSWEAQVGSDMTTMSDTNSNVRGDFQTMMNSTYPIGDLNVTRDPISFVDTGLQVVIEIPSSSSDNSADYATLVIIAVLLMAVVLLAVALCNTRHSIRKTVVRATVMGLPEVHE